MTHITPPPTLRQRLGGRRAVSWQGVVIGDSLIVLLATLLAAAAPGDRSPMEAATDVFAITMATAVLAAVYTGVAHLTFLRHRSRHPVPVLAAIGFHLSIGVIFLCGFAIGAEVLDAPRFGGSIGFSVAVLLGGLAVCVPTSLLLDDSDRYKESRHRLFHELTELEKLRVSEWSVRRALSGLVTTADSDPIARHLSDRIAALDLSDSALLSTDTWWDLSRGHHQGVTTSSSLDAPALSPPLDRVMEDTWAARYPVIRWSDNIRGAIARGIDFPGVTSALIFLLIWIVLSPSLSTPRSATIAALSAISTLVIYRAQWIPSALRSSWRAACALMVINAMWSGIVMTLWPEVYATGLSGLLGGGALTAGASLIGIALVSWVSSVMRARRRQIEALQAEVKRRSEESHAVLESLRSILAQLAQHAPWSQSATIAACAAGLQRVQQRRDSTHARRILDWTASVITAPLTSPVPTLTGRLTEVIHPWQALAEITLSCPADSEPLDQVHFDHIAAIVNDGVQRSCRIGDAEEISVTVTTSGPDSFTVTISDDGIPTTSADGLDRLMASDALAVAIEAHSPPPGSTLTVSYGR